MNMREPENTEQALAPPFWDDVSHAVDRQVTTSPVDTARGGRWSTLERELATTWEACGAYEWWAFGYLGVSSFLVVLFAQNLVHPWHLLLSNLFVLAVILVLCRLQTHYAGAIVPHQLCFTARWWHFWRHWYPHLFFLYCFEQLAFLMKLINPHWQDAKLIAFDYWLTGVNPSIWLEQFATPTRNELIQLAYLTYFVYLVVLGGILYYRREWRAYWAVMTYSMVGYSIGYLIAIFFPIQSPWFALAGSWHAPLSGGRFTATINLIEHFGRVRGAAFPSEHVAGSVAVLWGAWKFRRWLFWVMLPLVALMCFSTVWGRYHYVADIFGGIVTGSLGFLIGSWLMKRKGAAPAISEYASI
jgi:membrane-associated phospholipid phosphatase